MHYAKRCYFNIFTEKGLLKAPDDELDCEAAKIEAEQGARGVSANELNTISGLAR
jgi:hypothetical protein